MRESMLSRNRWWRHWGFVASPGLDKFENARNGVNDVVFAVVPEV